MARFHPVGIVIVVLQSGLWKRQQLRRNRPAAELIGLLTVAKVPPQARPMDTC